MLQLAALDRSPSNGSKTNASVFNSETANAVRQADS
jgi:hypothetical protein